MGEGACGNGVGELSGRPRLSSCQNLRCFPLAEHRPLVLGLYPSPVSLQAGVTVQAALAGSIVHP